MHTTGQDYRKLKTNAEKSKRFAVIGSGFVGSEISADFVIAGFDIEPNVKLVKPVGLKVDNMAGAGKVYDYLPIFYSDLFAIE